MVFLSSALTWLALTQAAPSCEGTHYLWPHHLAHGTPAEVERLETWLALSPNPHRVLLSPTEIDTHNLRHQAIDGAWRDLTAPLFTWPSAEDELAERLESMGKRLQDGEQHLYPEGADSLEALRARIQARTTAPSPTLHHLQSAADLRCLPTHAGIYRSPRDEAFDRNQCSRLEAGELVQVLAQSPDGWLYVRAGFVIGWLHTPELSAALSPSEASSWQESPSLVVTGDYVPAWKASGEIVFLRLGQRFPRLDEDDMHITIAWPSPAGFESVFIDKDFANAQAPFTLGEIHRDTPPFTRANVLSVLFSRLGDPYGWGGLLASRDCSGLLLDAFAAFGLKLGRNSRIQAQAGSTQVSIQGLSLGDKQAALSQANEEGLVFTFMPGHIMLHLGEYEGRPYALSAISEYLLPCSSGEAATIRIDRVAVTDYERGRATSRTSFLERLSALARFGL